MQEVVDPSSQGSMALLGKGQEQIVRAPPAVNPSQAEAPPTGVAPQVNDTAIAIGIRPNRPQGDYWVRSASLGIVFGIAYYLAVCSRTQTLLIEISQHLWRYHYSAVADYFCLDELESPATHGKFASVISLLTYAKWQLAIRVARGGAG